jgi:hypothetical protein
MRTNGVRRTILIVANLLILIGVALMAWIIVTAASRNHIFIDLSDGLNNVGFSDLSLVPGESTQYTVRLRNKNTNKCNLLLDFVEVEKDMTLKNYARVKIISNDTVVCDELLATIFENDNIVLPVDFDKGINTELTIVYYIPIEAGNEAKNADAVFELQIMATNK